MDTDDTSPDETNTASERAEGNPMAMLFEQQAAFMRHAFGAFAEPAPSGEGRPDPSAALTQALAATQAMWTGGSDPADPPVPGDPAAWFAAMEEWAKVGQSLTPDWQRRMAQESAELWQRLVDAYPISVNAPADGDGASSAPDLPYRDRRFADPAWSRHPAFAALHQTYLMLSEQTARQIDAAEGLEEEERKQMRFAARAMLEALSPANFPLLNPVVLERTLQTGGQNLATGMERLQRDLEQGQLTHTDAASFTLGENVAATPGKVVYETELFQLIQYSPTTDSVLAVPLVIFPPWINRFYILDLNPKKSFVRWAVEQGITVFMVSWKSADESLAHVEWDHYITAQIEAIDTVCGALDVPAVHTIGYCVAGTTLAATLAILARRGEAEKVASATFFTAQVDFAEAGELKLFVDDAKLEMIGQASKDGYLDGRYLAATFNALRGSDLIWNTVVNHYLLGEDYPAFDLLYWNGDVTNLPARWHGAYLRDLYRDNLLVEPDALEADGTAIDLRLIETPAYIQAGREDHIAPAESVFRALDLFGGPNRFVLAGSGHIAGVVNPPDARKYQYWTNESEVASLEEFIDGAEEHAGSWWPNWLEWLRGHDDRTLDVTGARIPGEGTLKAIEDAPGRYVRMR